MREPFFEIRKANLLERAVIFLDTLIHQPRCYDSRHPSLWFNEMEPNYKMIVEGYPERFGLYVIETQAQFECRECNSRRDRFYARKIIETGKTLIGSLV